MTEARVPAGHRDLRVWQEAMGLAEDVYALTRTFPRAEVYGLTLNPEREAAFSLDRPQSLVCPRMQRR